MMFINVSLYRDWRGRAGGRRQVREPDPLSRKKMIKGSVRNWIRKLDRGKK